AAAAAAGLAWLVVLILHGLGGYTMNDLPFYFTPWDYLLNNVQALWKVLEIFGANFDGLSGIWFALALLHLVGVAAVGWALARAARNYARVALVDLVLAVAIALNVVLYLLTNAADLAAHEVAVIVPYGAALTARMLVPATGPARRIGASRWVRASRRIRASRRVRVAGLVAGIAVLAGYTAGLGYEISQPSAAPPPDTVLTSWLAGHHLTYGLSGYWTSSSVTVDSGNHVQVRALRIADLSPDLWMSEPGWFDPALHDANFVVLDSQPGNFSYFEPIGLISLYFGTPARVYSFGPFTVLVFDKNLLRDLPG
ncbi:MAG: hypothetical protein ACRDOB_07380, partial [Streptosporangiaceae bacterium]